MQRLIARFLLLFALAGNFLPLALANTSAAPHACCRRNAAHHCHESSGTSDQTSVGSSNCCNRDCCRAARTSQWAQAQPFVSSAFSRSVTIHSTQVYVSFVPSESTSSDSTRAPPRSC